MRFKVILLTVTTIIIIDNFHLSKNLCSVHINCITKHSLKDFLDTCRFPFTSRMNQLPRVAHRLPAGGVAPPVHYRLQPTIYVRPSRQVPHASTQLNPFDILLFKFNAMCKGTQSIVFIRLILNYSYTVTLLVLFMSYLFDFYEYYEYFILFALKMKKKRLCVR